MTDPPLAPEARLLRRRGWRPLIVGVAGTVLGTAGSLLLTAPTVLEPAIATGLLLGLAVTVLLVTLDP